MAAGAAIPTGTAGSTATVTVRPPLCRSCSASSGRRRPPSRPSPTSATRSPPKHVRRGGSLVFTVKIRNRKAGGQHYVALLGDFPSGFRKIQVISKPRSVKCSVKRRDLSCWITSLDKGDSTTVRIRAWAGSRRGTATVKFGVLATKDPSASLSKLAKKVRLTSRRRRESFDTFPALKDGASPSWVLGDGPTRERRPRPAPAAPRRALARRVSPRAAPRGVLVSGQREDCDAVMLGLRSRPGQREAEDPVSA